MKQTKRVSQARQSTEIFFENQIKSSIDRARQEIREILISLRDGKSHFGYNNQVVTAAPCDFSRLIVEWQRSTSLDQSIRSVIVSALLSAEEKSQGSGFLAAGMWSAEKFKDFNVKTKRRCTFEEVKSCIEYFGSGGFSSACAVSLIEHGGLGHQVEYAEHAGPISLIETVDGKDISAVIDPLFGDRVGHTHDIESCFIVAVDGTVETVGSIHRLLESSAEVPIVIMAKTFLPDVANTMAESWLSGKAKCLPVCVNSWRCDNFLDLEKFGVSCVSIERGDVVSSIKVDKCRSLSFSSGENVAVIKFSEQKKRFKIQVKISQSLGGLVGPALDRVKSLLGYARICSRSGVVSWEDLCDQSLGFSELYSKNLVVPSSSLESGLKVHRSMQSILQEMACLITV